MRETRVGALVLQVGERWSNEGKTHTAQFAAIVRHFVSFWQVFHHAVYGKPEMSLPV